MDRRYLFWGSWYHCGLLAIISINGSINLSKQLLVKPALDCIGETKICGDLWCLSIVILSTPRLPSKILSLQTLRNPQIRLL